MVIGGVLDLADHPGAERRTPVGCSRLLHRARANVGPHPRRRDSASTSARARTTSSSTSARQPAASLDVARGPDAIGPGLTNDPLARITAVARGAASRANSKSMLGAAPAGVPARIDVIAVDRIPRVTPEPSRPRRAELRPAPKLLADLRTRTRRPNRMTLEDRGEPDARFAVARRRPRHRRDRNCSCAAISSALSTGATGAPAAASCVDRSRRVRVGHTRVRPRLWHSS